MSLLRVCLDNNGWSAVLNNDTDKDLQSIRRWFKLAQERQCRVVVPAVVVMEASANPNLFAVEQFNPSATPIQTIRR